MTREEEEALVTGGETGIETERQRGGEEGEKKNK